MSKKTPETRDQLYLVIQQQYFDAIAAGTKKSEYREIKPTTVRRYLKEITDETGALQDYEVIPYQTLKIAVGYAATRDWMVVEVTGIEWYTLTDEEGKEISYEYKEETYLAAEIEYKLGKILELHRK